MWLYMNRGKWWKTKWSSMLAVINMAVPPFSLVIVSIEFPQG